MTLVANFETRSEFAPVPWGSKETADKTDFRHFRSRKYHGVRVQPVKLLDKSLPATWLK